MSFRKALESLNDQLSGELLKVETELGDVYFYLEGSAGSLEALAMVDAGHFSKAAIHTALRRARDVDGNLLWPDEESRKNALDNKYTSLIMKLGASIVEKEKEVLGKNALAQAGKNSKAR